MEPVLIQQCFVNKHHKVRSIQLQLKITLAVQAGLDSYYSTMLPKGSHVYRMLMLTQCNLKL